MAEKTKKSSEGSRRSPARKPAAKRSATRKDDELDAPAAKKTASKPKKPKAARKSRNKKTTAKKSAAKTARRSTTKAGEKPTAAADSEETLAERRIAGGENAEAPVAGANENQPSVEASSGPSRAPSRTKPDYRARSGDSADSSPRPNTLVPTNGIHTTQRRIKRGLHQNRGVMALIAATLLGIFILGEQTTPPDMSDFEQQIAASQAIGPDPETTPADPSAGASARDSGGERFPSEPAPELDDSELIEMERLLARLELGPSAADGIVDLRTVTAIRLYQEFAGLPINGAPSRALLADMREVAGILDNGS